MLNSHINLTYIKPHLQKWSLEAQWIILICKVTHQKKYFPDWIHNFAIIKSDHHSKLFYALLWGKFFFLFCHNSQKCKELFCPSKPAFIHIWLLLFLSKFAKLLQIFWKMHTNSLQTITSDKWKKTSLSSLDSAVLLCMGLSKFF